MDYKARYEEWISNSYFDEDTRAELESIKEDENEIKERFYMDLEFGTAGLRGRSSPGLPGYRAIPGRMRPVCGSAC